MSDKGLEANVRRTIDTDAFGRNLKAVVGERIHRDALVEAQGA